MQDHVDVRAREAIRALLKRMVMPPDHRIEVLAALEESPSPEKAQEGTGLKWGGPSSDARAEWNKPFTIPGEAQAPREGEKKSPGPELIRGMTELRDRVQADKAKRTAFRQHCKVVLLDWRDTAVELADYAAAGAFRDLADEITKAEDNYRVEAPVSQPPEGKTETVKCDCGHAKENHDDRGQCWPPKLPGEEFNRACSCNKFSPAQSPAQQGAEKPCCEKRAATMNNPELNEVHSVGCPVAESWFAEKPVDQSEMMRVVEKLANRIGESVSEARAEQGQDTAEMIMSHDAARLLRAMAKVVEAKTLIQEHSARAELSTLIKSLNTETKA